MTISEIPASYLLALLVGYVLGPFLFFGLRVIWDLFLSDIFKKGAEARERARNKKHREEALAWFSTRGGVPKGWEMSEWGSVYKKFDAPDGREYKVYLFIGGDDRVAVERWCSTRHGMCIPSLPQEEDFTSLENAIAEGEWWIHNAHDFSSAPSKA